MAILEASALTVETDSSPMSRSDKMPPGFRFHPTDEELVLFYLKRKICRRRLPLNIISELDVYKWDPEELPGQSSLKTGDRQWFFFSPRDRKYPNAARSNRATRHGYWKATGKDRSITSKDRTVGVKKTLVFYEGRAPSGGRTDWVMHEYTLDEEELLQRCQNAQDYYALYKVFKKSGPGPKNGEQYGAPFKEEDWADEEYSDVTKAVDQKICPKEPVPVSSVDNVGDNSQALINDIEEFFNGIADGPELEQPDVNVYSYLLPQVVTEEEAQSTLADPSSREVVASEPLQAFDISATQFELPASIEFAQYGASEWLQVQETPEITHAPKNCTAEAHAIEDFLEMDDLISNDPPFCTVEQPVESLQFEDGFSELDLFHDAAMFLHDIGSAIQENVVTTQINSFDGGFSNECNYQSQPPVSNLVDQSNSQLWMHEQTINGYNATEMVQGVQPCPSGFSNDTSSVINQSSQIQNKEVGGAVSRFSSTVWAFVESIPTTPASASESAIVSRALERMSSFSRVRMSSVPIDVGAVNGAAIVKSGRSRGFFLLVLGVFGAIVGVLIGSLRLWERCVS